MPFLKYEAIAPSRSNDNVLRWSNSHCYHRLYSPWILGLKPVEQGVLVEGSSGRAVAAVPLDVGDRVGALHDLDEPRFVPGGQAAVRDHPDSAGRNRRGLV